MRKRSHFTAEFNRQQVEQTCEPGSSIAGLAQAHGINANQLHKWRGKILGATRQPPGAASTPDPRVVPDAPMRPPADDPSSGRVEIKLSCTRGSLYRCIDLAAFNIILLTFIPRHLIHAQENGEGQST
jgi:transposase